MNLIQVSIHAWKPFSNARNTWFAGGGLTYGGMIIERSNHGVEYTEPAIDERVGLSFSAGGGYLFSRDANVSLRITSRLYFPTFRLGGSYPAGALISVALFF